MQKASQKKRRRNKPKLNTKGKAYTLKDSALYNLSTKRRLAKVLGFSIGKLERLVSDENYWVSRVEKANGGYREIQVPKGTLQWVHARIASLLARIAMPGYVHSGVKGRSNITNAKSHVGEHPVLTLDIKGFFPSVTKKSVFHFFRDTMNAAPDVAGILAELCTYHDHLPTGSQISMSLAFWANHQMFDLLNEFCAARSVTVTCYVDDLTFSGDRVDVGFQHQVASIVERAGLLVHPEKTRLYDSGTTKAITGVAVGTVGMKVMHKHHKSIHELFGKLWAAGEDAQRETLVRKLCGSMCAAGQIDPKFKQRIQNLRCSELNSAAVG